MALALVYVSEHYYNVEMKAVMTSSMEPELPVGSLLFVQPTAYEDIYIGDDITFVRDQNLTLVTHRVIEKDDKTKFITTQGIANNAADAPTNYQNVVGKVIFHIPYVGYFVIWISTKKGKVICEIIIVAVVAFGILISKSDDTKKSNKKATPNH